MGSFGHLVALKMSRFPAQPRKQDRGAVVLRNFPFGTGFVHLPVMFVFHFFYKVVALNKRNLGITKKKTTTLLSIAFPLPGRWC